MKRFLLLIFSSFLSPLLAFSQEITMADNFRSEGKIYVVIAVMAIILAGLFIYLFMLGNKVSKLERRLNERK